MWMFAPCVQGDRPDLGFIPVLADSGIEGKTHRVVAEGNFVVLHNSYDNASILGGETLVANRRLPDESQICTRPNMVNAAPRAFH